jgi:hypothetical protein
MVWRLVSGDCGCWVSWYTVRKYCEVVHKSMVDVIIDFK